MGRRSDGWLERLIEGLNKTATIVEQVRQGAGDDIPPPASIIEENEEKNGRPADKEVSGPTV